MPSLLRPFLRFLRVDRFLWLDIAEAPSTPGSQS
jgi:hypothetical protein